MKTFSTFLFFCLLYSAHGQQVQLQWTKTNILLGEPLTLKLRATITPGQVPTFFFIDTLPHFEVLNRSAIDTIQSGQQLILSQTVTLTSWDSGSWQVPSLMTDLVPSGPVKINVNYTDPWNPNQPYHDIKGIVPVKKPGQSTWWWYIVGAIVLIALFLLFFPAGKKDKTASELDSHAYKKALEQLARLQGANVASVNIKQYHTELINIFRSYLKGAKGIQSFSKTTDDLSVKLQDLKMPSQEYNQLVQALRLSDLVKFAQYNPESRMNTDSFDTIKESITIIENQNAV